MGTGAGPARAELPAVEVMEKASQGDWGAPYAGCSERGTHSNKWKEQEEMKAEP